MEVGIEKHTKMASLDKMRLKIIQVIDHTFNEGLWTVVGGLAFDWHSSLRWYLLFWYEVVVEVTLPDDL